MNTKIVSVITLTVFLASLVMVSVPVPVQSSPSPVTVYVDMSPEGYIPGVPRGNPVNVEVWIESPPEWDNTINGIVGWSLGVHVDPAVLTPLDVTGASAGYWLYDFCIDNGYYGNVPYLLFGTNSSDFKDVAEFICDFMDLGVGAGGNGKLCTLTFESLSETAYTKIDLYNVYYYTTAGGSEGIPVDIVVDGHYNQRARVAIDQTKCDFFQWGTDHAVSVLTAEGYAVDVFEVGGTIKDERLAGYCTLIIACPQDPYTEAEVSAILQFVESGHGLLFLGEYGPAWSDNSEGAYPAAASPIMEPLGISINNDYLKDETNHEPSPGLPYSIPHITTFPVSHPVTNGIGTYMPAATATLVVASPSTTIATGDDDTTTQPPYAVGYQPVLAACNYGSGRAVVAGDYNWIDLAWGPYYDNTQLLINVIRWLCPGVRAAFRQIGDTIETSELPTGTENSLTAKLNNVIPLLDKGNANAAKHKLTALINQVEALRGKKLTDEQADYLISEAQRIIALING